MNAHHGSAYGLTPDHFLSEVQDFRETIANPALTAEEKKRAYGLIVHHAATIDPRALGFESAGVALKEALCMWLDFGSREQH